MLLRPPHTECAISSVCVPRGGRRAGGPAWFCATTVRHQDSGNKPMPMITIMLLQKITKPIDSLSLKPYECSPTCS